MTTPACTARKVAMCLTGIPPELRTRLLETGIDSSLKTWARFANMALAQQRSKSEIAAKVRARARSSGIGRPRSPLSRVARSARTLRSPTCPPTQATSILRPNLRAATCPY